MIFKNLFRKKGPGIKRLGRDETPSIDSLFDSYPEGKVYETHADNIYKALVFVLPGYDFDASSGWRDAGKRHEAARIAGEMTGYPDTDRAFWRAVSEESGEICAYILTSVPGARAALEGRVLALDATHFQYAYEPEGGRGSGA